MRGNDIKDLVRVNGSRQVAVVLMDALDGGELKTEDFSLREMWEAFVGPVGTTLEFAQNREGFVELREAVDSSVYQAVAGKVIGKEVIDGYNRVASIGDMLVTNYPTNQRYDKLLGFSPTEGVKTVNEGQPYEETGFGSKFVGTGTAYKKGRILPVTEEAVYFDDTGKILDQARELGEDARMDKEKTILKAVLGITNCYYPSDSATSLYGASPTLKTSNPLIDWTSIEIAELELAESQDEEGNTVVIVPTVLLVPSALKRSAQRIVGAIEVNHKTPVSGTAGTTAQARETVSVNPMKNEFVVISSALVHQLQVAAGTSAAVAKSNWWFGDPKKQFRWKEIWPLQTLKAKEGDYDRFHSDVVAKFKVRFYGGIFAKDQAYFQLNQE